MSADQARSASGGVSFIGLLFLLFLGLKLTGHIAWSWWWVTAPLWAPWALAAAFLVVVGLILAVIAVGEWIAG